MTRTLIDVTWLVRLRWAFAVAQVALVVSAIVESTAVAPMATALFLGSTSNAILHRRVHRRVAGAGDVAAVLAVDVALLTGLLAATSGASNPFVPLYLLPVALGATLLPRRAAWALVALTAAAYAGLLWLGPAPAHDHGHDAMQRHVAGMFAAWAVAAPVVVFAIGSAREALLEADRRTAEAQAVQIRSERLAALATLAAGASHELATPLGTILLAAREVERATTDERTRSDAVTIQEEVQRCRDVLAELSAEAGTNRAEQGEWIAVRDLLEEALDPPPPRAVGVRCESDETLVRLPVRPVVLALRRLVGNACEATPPEESVHLYATLRDNVLEVGVEDRGAGMAPDALARASEPFFTTKPTGRGLGLFYASVVARDLGGRLVIASSPGAGTRAALVLPGLPLRPPETS